MEKWYFSLEILNSSQICISFFNIYGGFNIW